jgi:hypothetical protein
MRQDAVRNEIFLGRPRKFSRGEQIPLAIAVGTKDVKMRLRQIVPFNLDMLASKVKVARSWRRSDRATTVR